MMIKPSISAQLARFVVELGADALPREVIERAKEILLDFVGVALIGSTTAWSRGVQDLALDEGARPESTIFGSGRVSRRLAALVNGTSAHSLELDDTHEPSLSHPGCVVNPVVFALAEAKGCTGQELLLAMILGYEVQCRIGRVLGRHLLAEGLHPTANLGVFGAVAAAGKLMGLSIEQLTDAIGLAASMMGGTMEFTRDFERNLVKRLYGGLPADRGILAAQLAGNGISAPRTNIEGSCGVAQVLARVTDLGNISMHLGESYELMSVSIKRYACCKQFHSMIEAISACQMEHPFAIEAVRSIEVGATHAMIDGHMEYRPRSIMSAQYSLPFVAAVAMASDPTVPTSFEASAWGDEKLLQISEKVRETWDPRLEELYPERFGAWVQIQLVDGQMLKAEVFESSSSAQNPLGREKVQAKFRAITSNILSREKQNFVIQAVMSLEQSSTITSLMETLGHAEQNNIDGRGV